jgi:SAM-dependent methyltransferase
MAPRDVGGQAPAADPAVAGASVVVDARWGYRRLEPLPDEPDLERFYESGYRDAVDAGGRAPDLARLVAGGPDADRERAWLDATIHTDVLDALEIAAAQGLPRRCLDVGCGTGELVRFLLSAGWDASGTEPAAGIAAIGQARGLSIHTVSAAAFVQAWRSADGAPFGAVTLLNVLEHVPDPAALVMTLSTIMAPGGRLVVRVPNDFNPLQEAARMALNREPWWVVVPDHVNYFDHGSIASLLERLGFQIEDQFADFPMELFLLMGDDYTADSSLGSRVHERRRRLDMGLEQVVRRSLGRAWAAAGVGRNAVVVARRPSA